MPSPQIPYFKTMMEFLSSKDNVSVNGAVNAVRDSLDRIFERKGNVLGIPVNESTDDITSGLNFILKATLRAVDDLIESRSSEFNLPGGPSTRLRRGKASPTQEQVKTTLQRFGKSIKAIKQADSQSTVIELRRQKQNGAADLWSVRSGAANPRPC